MWSAIFQHEIKQRLTSPSDWLYPLVFFVMVLVLFPIAFGTQEIPLTTLAAPAVWIAVLFSILLGVNRLFQLDVENGMLEQLLVARVSLTLWVMLRLGIFWLTSCGLLMVASLLIMPLYGVSWAYMQLVLLTLLLGSPTLVLFSALAAVLTGQQLTSGVMIPLVAMPLQLPVVIFSLGLVQMQQTAMNGLPTIALLLAMLIFSMMVIPWAIAAVLKMSV